MGDTIEFDPESVRLFAGLTGEIVQRESVRGLRTGNTGGYQLLRTSWLEFLQQLEELPDLYFTAVTAYVHGRHRARTLSTTVIA